MDKPQVGTWQAMIDSSQALLLRRTGLDVQAWLDRAREAGIADDAGLRTWLLGQGVGGYAQSAVCWEMFGYPDFFLQDASELLAGQYADRPQLRAIADSLMSWAGSIDEIVIQMRKTFISLHTERRKFAQITPTNRTTVDVFLRVDAPAAGRLEAAKVRPDDPFNRRIRFTSTTDFDQESARLLRLALRQNL
jgi:hypothetical protein